MSVVADRPDPPKLDTTISQTARIWNHLLGGKDNFAADREVGDQIIASMPELAAAPDARIVYVDNDPLVLAHARALLTSSPEGATDYIGRKP